MKSFFRVSTIFFLTKSYMEVLDSNYMAVNIEMNYYNGSSYVGLRPMGDFGNMSGSLSLGDSYAGNVSMKEKIRYIGTDNSTVTVNSNINVYPCLIIGGVINNFSSFAFIHDIGDKQYMYAFRVTGNSAVDYSLNFGVFRVSKLSNQKIQFSANYGAGIYGEHIIKANDISNGTYVQPKATYKESVYFYNELNTTYNYLIIA